MRRFASHSNASPPAGSSTGLPIRLAATHGRAEREAERAADRVMDSRPQSRPAVHSTGFRLASQSETPAHREIFPHSGHPIDPAARSRMESRFQFDFSSVRIHRDEASQQIASALSARAFTLGGSVAFGKGEYAPETSAGQRLLAHELAHVVQQTQSPAPAVQRAPLDPKEVFGDRDASVVDDAIAASSVAQYIPKKERKTIAGNYEYSSPEQFAKHFRDYGKSQELSTDEVGGFVNRKSVKPIQLRSPGKIDGHFVAGSTLEAAIHETIHLNSKQTFASTFGPTVNEGVTQHFTKQVLGAPGTAYPQELAFAEGMIAAIGPDGERQVAESFFGGKTDLYDRIQKALNSKNTLVEWKEKMNGKDPKGWERANFLLAEALKPATSAAPPAKNDAPAAQKSGAKN